MSRPKGEGSLYLLPDHAGSFPGGAPGSAAGCREGARGCWRVPRPLPAPRPSSCFCSGRPRPRPPAGTRPFSCFTWPDAHGFAALASEPGGELQVQKQTRTVSPRKCWTQLHPEPGPCVCPSPGPGLGAPDAVSAEDRRQDDRLRFPGAEHTASPGSLLHRSFWKHEQLDLFGATTWERPEPWAAHLCVPPPGPGGLRGAWRLSLRGGPGVAGAEGGMELTPHSDAGGRPLHACRAAPEGPGRPLAKPCLRRRAPVRPERVSGLFPCALGGRGSCQGFPRADYLLEKFH